MSTVEKIDEVVYNELITVYNFEVEDFHLKQENITLSMIKVIRKCNHSMS